MSDIYDLVDDLRQQLLSGEREAASRMVREYGQIWRALDRQIRDLIAEYEQSGGQETSAAWLRQFDRLTTLRRQVIDELSRYARMVEGEVVSQQIRAIGMAGEHAERLTLGEMGEIPPGVYVNFNRLPTGALNSLVGFLGDGSALRELLDELPEAGGKIVADGLIEGMTMGYGAEQIARNIRRGLGGNLAHSLTIARTEVIRAYRESNHQTMLANKDILKGWEWVSKRGPTTCASCWAMDGTIHELEERLDDHPNGGCVKKPITKTWAELGFKNVPEAPRNRRTPATGIEAFERLSEPEQLKILGPAKYAAWLDGAIKLSDLVGQKRDPRWGTMRYERSLFAILGKKAGDYYQSKPQEGA